MRPVIQAVCLLVSRRRPLQWYEICGDLEIEDRKLGRFARRLYMRSCMQTGDYVVPWMSQGIRNL